MPESAPGRSIASRSSISAYSENAPAQRPITRRPEPSTLVTATVADPQPRAQSRASTISWVEPDWLTPMVTVSARSSRAS